MASFDSSRPRPAKPKLSRSRIDSLAANPGTRAALADKYLSPSQLKQRQLNKRLDTPVTPGSTLTNRELARQANTATEVAYGPSKAALQTDLKGAQQHETDVAGWYQNYLNRLSTYRQQVAANNTQGATALQGLSTAAQGMGTGVEGTAEQSAAQQAQGVRQSNLAAFQAYQTQLANDANNYAAAQEGVVGPGRKVVAQTTAAKATQGVRDQQKALADQIGAANSKYRSDTVTSEQKNVLANQIATGKTAVQQKAANEKIRHDKASESNTAAARKATAEAKREVAAAKASEPNKYGVPNAEWKSMTTTQRQKVIAAAKASGGAAKSSYLPQTAQNSFKDHFDTAVAVVRKVRGHYTRAELASLLQNGRAAQTVYVDKNGNPVDKSAKGAVAVKVPAVPKITNSAALTAALDSVYDNHLSNETVKKLHDRKIKVKQLGVKTAKDLARTPSKPERPAVLPRLGPAGGLGQIPGGS